MLISECEDEDSSFTTLYIPIFYDEYMDFFINSPSLKKEEFSKRNWITDKLMNKIKKCTPKRNNIDTEKDNLRDKEALEITTNNFFPEGRIFASHIRLLQVAAKFTDLWVFKTTNSDPQIQCHFGKPNY